MISNELNHLAVQANRIATEHGFTNATPGEDIALMHSELSEALEDIRAGEKLNFLWFETKDGRAFESQDEAKKALNGELAKPCGVPSELADVIIRIAHFCGKHGIDISQAVREKMAYNESRPFKHGGKKL